MNNTFKKVLVTGADGFIGSHLTEILLEKGFLVRALAQYNSFNSWGWLEQIHPNPNLEIICGDIRDAHFCKDIVKDVDCIFNLAALIAIPFSYIAPDSYVDTNIKGTLNLCQAAKEFGSIRFIHTSTSEVYGTAQYVPIDEKHPKQPQSPYSASKIGADAMALSFYNSFDLPVTIARPFNTYGPRQSARAVIPTIISQIASGIKEIKLGSTKPTRDFTYVIDTCMGILSVAECKKSIGKEINIASNYEISILDVFNIIKDSMNAEVEIIGEDERKRPKKSEVFRLWGDNSLLHSLTGFKPTTDISKGLNLTIEWFLNPHNLQKYKSGINNL